MRAAVSSTLTLLAVAALSATSSMPVAAPVGAGGAPGARLTSCATKADQTSLAAHSKANSFAPHAASHNRVYGAPIQPRIFKSRPKKKPQLTSSPVPGS
jgi:hypothetical protein